MRTFDKPDWGFRGVEEAAHKSGRSAIRLSEALRSLDRNRVYPKPKSKYHS